MQLLVPFEQQRLQVEWGTIKRPCLVENAFDASSINDLPVLGNRTLKGLNHAQRQCSRRTIWWTDICN